MSSSDRIELERLASADSSDDNLQFRAKIVLSWAAGDTGEQTAKRLGTSRRTVCKWRRRFGEGGVEALHDLPRPGAPRSIEKAKIAELLRLHDSPPPDGKPQWTTRMLARKTGLSQSTVTRVVRRHRLRSGV